MSDKRAAKRVTGTNSANSIISLEKRLKGLKDIEALSRKLGMGHKPSEPQQGKKANSNNEYANDRAKDSTIARYGSVWEAFTTYCIATGDLRSATMCFPPATIKDPCSPSLKTAINFARYCVYSKDTIHNCFFTKKPVKFIGSRKPVKCIGRWSAPSTLELFSTALRKKSSFFTLTVGAYEEECRECIALHKKKSKFGCMRGHYTTPCLMPRGGIAENSTFKTQMSLLTAYIEDHYVSRHTHAYHPKQLRSLRLYLLSKNSMEGLMVWTLLLVAIKQFLRICEATTLTHDSFDMTLASVSKNSVKSLVTKIRGKKDTKDVYLQLWNDTECDEFCPVTAVLIWIALSGSEKGFIFPADVGAKWTQRKCNTKHITYDSILKTVKRLSKDVLRMDFDTTEQDVIIGTHFARRTGLLLATWSFLSASEEHRKQVANQPILEAMLSNDCRNSSGGAGGNVQSGMRHAGVQSTKTYIKDNATMYQLVRENTKNLQDLKVGQYKGILIGTPSMARKIIDSKNKLSLSELARWYVFDILQVDPTKYTILEVFHKAARKTSEKFQKLPPSQQFLHSLIGDTRYDAYCELVKKEETPQETPQETKKQPLKQESKFVVLPPHFQLDFNKCKTTEDKVEIAVATWKEANTQISSGKKLQIRNEKCPDYFILYRYGKLVDCLNTCFRGDIHRFAQKCPKVTSKFRCAGRTKIGHSYMSKSTK